MPLSMLLAASPLPSDAFQPYTPPGRPDSATVDLGTGTVETFDPTLRAERIASLVPRFWRGNYRSFDGAAPLPVELRIESATPMGQMVDLRGSVSLGGVLSPVQGNINAKSDQLDLLLLGDALGGGLEAGGEFQGLQGLSLSGWHAPRLTSLGGRLQLVPSREATPGVRQGVGVPIRGLW